MWKNESKGSRKSFTRPEIWLRTRGDVAQYFPGCRPDFWPEFPQGRIFWWGRIIRPQLRPDYPALESSQRLDFERGYLYPLLLPSNLLNHSRSSSPLEPPQETQESQDLLLQPSKALDLWRIEGEDPVLHLNRSDLHFPSYT